MRIEVPREVQNISKTQIQASLPAYFMKPIYNKKEYHPPIMAGGSFVEMK
jgi:hypothetical protein